MTTTFYRFAFAAAICIPSAAVAQNVTADHERIAEVLRDAGYRATIEGDIPAERYVASGTSGIGFTISFFDCNKGGADCKTVMFSAWSEDETPPSFEEMNQFNMCQRWGRAYIDEEGDPTIEMDLDLENGGISPELFIDNVEYFDVALRQFQTFLASNVVPTQ